ncbi:MAG: cupin domain-containing protein [Gaiellaceae bacterium]
MPAVVHWDDVEAQHNEVGPLSSRWSNLGAAAGCVTVGVQRIQIDPGKRSTPAHMEGEEEEIFYVLGGSGVSWQDGETYEVGPGDCLVHLAGREAHTLVAGGEGLEVLAFGMRARAELAWFPRLELVRVGPAILRPDPGPHQWHREAALGELALPEPSERPGRIVNVREVEGERRDGETLGFARRDLGRAGGSERTGLTHVRVDPGRLSARPHCHSAEEEIFVVLGGEGRLELTPSPLARERGAADERHEVRAGSVVARPAGSQVAHTFRAGEDGLELLAYGTRNPGDIVYYPRSGTVFLRGVGVLGRMEHTGWAED